MAVNKKSNGAQVLIVGAGPTGLALAIELALLGVSIRIIDKSSQASISSKAMSLQSKSLERFFNLGVIEGVMKTGRALAAMTGYSGSQRIFATLLQDQKISPMAFTLHVPQSVVEEVLITRLKELGVEVERDTELERFADTSDGVKVYLRRKGNQEEIQVPYMVACDGANSLIRRTLNIRFEGNSQEEEYLMADGAVEWEEKPNQSYMYLRDGSFLTLHPYNDRDYRVVICKKGDGSDKITPPTQEEIEDLIDYFVPKKLKFSDMTWSSTFKIKRKCALRMRVGNIFLAGDAAHIHSPLGSQGLNAGLQDATNLAWKLGYYLNGIAPEKILDSYEAERLPVAKNVYMATNLLLSLLFWNDKRMVHLRDHMFPMLSSRPWIRSKIVNLFSEIACNYRTSPLIAGTETIKDRVVSWGQNKIRGGLFAGDKYRNVILMYPDTFKRIHLFELVPTNCHTLLSFVGDDPKKMTECIELQQRIVSMFPGLLNSVLLVGQHAVDYNHFGSHLPNAYLDVDGAGHKIYGCNDAGLYLIRPDGYIEFVSIPGNEQALIDHIKKLYPGYENCEKYDRPSGLPIAKASNDDK